MSQYVDRVLAELKEKNANEPEFLQTVEEVLGTLAPPIGRVVKLFLKVCSKPKNFMMERFTDGAKRKPPLYGPIAPLNCTR